MSMFSSLRVDLPSGIYRQKRSTGIAVYQYTRHFRDKNGKSRHQSSMIGILDEISGLLIPNDNYFKINGIVPPVSDFHNVIQYGYPFAFYHLCESLGLTSILSDIFPNSWKDMITAACYIPVSYTHLSLSDNDFK